MGKASLATSPSVQEPKRPQSAYFIFISQKRGSIEGKFSEQAKELSKMWAALSPEEKKKFEDEAKEKHDQYEKDLAAYRANPQVARFEKAVKSIRSGPAPKPKAAPKPAPQAAAPAPAAGRGKGAGRTAGQAAPKPKAAPAKKAGSDSDSDVMGSDSSSSSRRKKD